MQSSSKNKLQPLNVIAGCAAFMALVLASASLSFAKSVLIPFVLAIFISFSVTPLIRLLQSKLKVPRIAAVFLTLGIVIGVLVLVSILVTSNIRSFIINIDNYKAQVVIMVDGVLDYIHRYGFDFQKSDVTEAIQKLPIFSFMGGAATNVFGFFMDALLVVIFVMFMLTGQQYDMPKKGIWKDISAKTRAYLSTIVVSSLANGIFTALVFTFFGLPMAAMFGVLAFMFNFIPTVGPLITFVLPLPVAILHFQNIWMSVICIAIPGVMQFISGNVIEPKFIGDALDLHPVTILLSLMFWGMLWGIPGMILATPLCVIIKLFFEQFDQTQRIALLMSGNLKEAL